MRPNFSLTSTLGLDFFAVNGKTITLDWLPTLLVPIKCSIETVLEHVLYWVPPHLTLWMIWLNYNEAHTKATRLGGFIGNRCSPVQFGTDYWLDNTHCVDAPLTTDTKTTCRIFAAWFKVTRHFPFIIHSNYINFILGALFVQVWRTLGLNFDL